ncbi:hypothetical protein F5J12DRAFT_694545, partial [Pisolithus orientalis]|uniref:uncharacterized protein n=1 Tax=Pisolithus orientalis TaxID=936130 RepID=UPI002224DFCD
PTAPLSPQVGRHAGVQTTEDGSLLLKPVLSRELGNLVDNLPEATAAHSLPAFGSPNGTTTTIVLENLTYGFHIPCIPDVKLRTVLYNGDVPQAKKERTIRTSANTISLSTAIRSTGFQVYPLVDVQELSAHSNVLTPRKYGEAVKPEHLPD